MTEATLLRRYTFKLYPSATQAAAMEARRLTHQRLYNAALQQRVEAWARQRKTVTLYDQQREVPALRKEIEELAPISVCELRGTLARVDRAMRAFYQRARRGAGASSGFPRFQPEWNYPGWSYEDKSGWSWTWRGGRRADLRIMGLGTIKARGNPPHRWPVRACTVLKRDGAWWASIVMACPPRREAGHQDIEIAFDLVTSFATVRTVEEGAVHALAERPNLPVLAGDQAISMVPAAASPQMREGCNASAPRISRPPAAASPQMREGCNLTRPGRRSPPAAASPQMREGCNDAVDEDDPLRAAASPQMREGCNRPRRAGRRDAPAASQQMREGCNGANRPGVSASPAASPQMREGCKLKSSSCDDHVVVDLQRAIARCVRGSHKYRALRRLKALRQARQARRRRHELHQWTTAVVSAARSLRIVAPPSIRDATASGRGSARQPGAAVAWKAQFNRRVLDFAPAEAIAQITYKAAEAGIDLRIESPEDHPIDVGNNIVAAVATARRIRRIAKRSTHED